MKTPQSFRVLADTSFLGNLMDREAAFHANATAYFLQLRQLRAQFFISTLVAAEYSAKGDIETVIDTLSARLLSFDFPESQKYGQMARKENWFAAKSSRAQKRDLVIDLMLISQSVSRGLTGVISADKAMCHRIPTSTGIQVFNITEPLETTAPLWKQAAAAGADDDPNALSLN